MKSRVEEIYKFKNIVSSDDASKYYNEKMFEEGKTMLLGIVVMDRMRGGGRCYIVGAGILRCYSLIFFQRV